MDWWRLSSPKKKRGIVSVNIITVAKRNNEAVSIAIMKEKQRGSATDWIQRQTNRKRITGYTLRCFDTIWLHMQTNNFTANHSLQLVL